MKMMLWVFMQRATASRKHVTKGCYKKMEFTYKLTRFLANFPRSGRMSVHPSMTYPIDPSR